MLMETNNKEGLEMCNKARLSEVLNEGHEFVAWVMQNGHRHTVRAFGEDIPPNTPDPAYPETNEGYVDYVCAQENTAIQEVLYADTENDAIAENIIDSDLNYY